MNRVRRFLKRPRAERHLWIASVLLLITVRTGLVLLPFHTMVRLVARFARPRSPADSKSQTYRDQVVWAVNSAGEHLPWKRACLQEALVGQLLLTRGGVPVRLQIGVRKGPGGGLLAHAWLESDGDVLIGGPQSVVEGYTVLEDFDRVSLHF